jgi:transcriptional regulator with XRE-family HTH domain
MDINNIGKRMLSIRQKKNLSQAKFAEFTNLCPSYIAAVEVGRKKPSLNFVVSVLEATKVSVDWLFTGKGSMYPQIKEINEDRVAYGADKTASLDIGLDSLKNHWDKLSDEQKRVLMRQIKEMVENNAMREFISKIVSQPGELLQVPS